MYNKMHYSTWKSGEPFSCCDLASHWQDQDIAEAVAAIEADAQAEGVMLDGDIAECLIDKAELMFLAAGGDGLTAVHLAELVADGRITQDEADERNA